MKRIALVFAATAVLAVPIAANGILPDEACHAVYPAPTQPALCGRGTGGPGVG